MARLRTEKRDIALLRLYIECMDLGPMIQLENRNNRGVLRDAFSF